MQPLVPLVFHPYIPLHLEEMFFFTWGVAGGDGKLGCLCGKAGTVICVMAPPIHLGALVNGYTCGI